MILDLSHLTATTLVRSFAAAGATANSGGSGFACLVCHDSFYFCIILKVIRTRCNDRRELSLNEGVGRCCQVDQDYNKQSENDLHGVGVWMLDLLSK